MSGVGWSRENPGEGTLDNETVAMTRAQFQALFNAVGVVLNPPKDKLDMSEPAAKAWLKRWQRKWFKRIKAYLEGLSGAH